MATSKRIDRHYRCLCGNQVSTRIVVQAVRCLRCSKPMTRTPTPPKSQRSRR